MPCPWIAPRPSLAAAAGSRRARDGTLLWWGWLTLEEADMSDADMSDNDDALDLDMAAAMLQSNATDVHIMLKVLAGQLSEVLGPRVVVDRAGGPLPQVRRGEGPRGDAGRRCHAGPGRRVPVRCSVAHSSGGIRIRSETVDLDNWLKRLLNALQQEATHSEGARQALERIVIGGSS